MLKKLIFTALTASGLAFTALPAHARGYVSVGIGLPGVVVGPAYVPGPAYYGPPAPVYAPPVYGPVIGFAPGYYAGWHRGPWGYPHGYWGRPGFVGGYGHWGGGHNWVRR